MILFEPHLEFMTGSLSNTTTLMALLSLHNASIPFYNTCLGLTSKTKVLITPRLCHCWKRTDERFKRIISKVPYYFHIRMHLNKKQTVSLLSRSTFPTIHFYRNIYSNTSLFNLRYRLHEEHVSLPYYVGNS